VKFKGNFPKFTFRYVTLILVLLVGVAGLGWRVVILQVFEKGFLKSQGDARTLRVVSMPAYRGMILDRNHEPLAISTPVESIWMNPKELDLTHAELPELAKILQMTVDQLKDKAKNPSKEFVYLQRHLPPAVAEQVKKLEIPGIHAKSEYRRYYPAAEVVAHVVGFTDIDDHGQEGLELAYDTWLSGAPGSKRIIKDRMGRQVEYIEALKDMRPGQDVVLSIDQRLQYLAHRELKAAVDEHRATAGTAVVLDVQTGEILAMVNHPTFNPNQRNRQRDGRYRNRAVVDRLEPGSVMKTFAITSALQHSNIKPTTLINTSPGILQIGSNVVKEVENKNYGIIDVATILRKSSNVGVTKLTLALPADKLWETYSRVGFGISTGSGFPGESGGYLERPHQNRPFVLATMAFGYGLAVTPLQLAQGYAVLGANGIKRPVTFIKTEEKIAGEQVIDPRVAQQMVDMLESVIELGTLKAKVLGYHTAGKSGTARKAGKHGYQADGGHVAVFAGLAPARKPKFAIAVFIDEPRAGVYYGGQVAAPVFSKIAAGALRLFNVPPDTLEPAVPLVQTEEPRL